MCTRVFWSQNDVAKVVARTLDFSVPDEPRLWWLPAGMTRQGHPDLPAVAWTSGFASVSVAEWDQAYLEGLNSAGLAAHALMYTTARPWPRACGCSTSWTTSTTSPMPLPPLPTSG